MKIYAHTSQAIGTPDLIRLEDTLFALRFESMKMASATGALRHLLDEGTLSPGDTVVDSSSGIYAHALALACHRFGLRCYIVGSTTIDKTLAHQLACLGATVEHMPPSTSLKLDQSRRVARVKELTASNPSWHWMQQYHCPDHYLGYEPIGADLAASLREQGYESVSLVSAVGSGASSAGLARGITSTGLAHEVIGIQPFGSITFGSAHVDDPDMLIAGIGSSIEFRNVQPELYNAIHWVSFPIARAGTISLLKNYGLFAGLSSGACFAAATFERTHACGTGTPMPHSPHVHHRSPRRKHATVIVTPDTGHRYTPALFRDEVSIAPDVDVVRDWGEPQEVTAETVHAMRLPWCYTRDPQAFARQPALEVV
ncbi:pyridoxal-phosphate dependent enzyme [Corynebacterium kroppenstedtii]|uniref:pyridoxal-phosphate dependent enzyme n=1 Tax=Corynebacterium sp. PCR 32 TaxID=3351342 RepID=UPI0030A432CB